MKRRRLVSLIALLAIAGCVVETFVPVPPKAIAGNWSLVRPLGTPPGSSMVMILKLDGTDLVGTGGWSGEAGPSGTLSAIGTIGDESLHLDITFKYEPGVVGAADRHAVFDGHLKTHDEIVGTLTYDGLAPVSVSFTRVNFTL